MMRRRLLAILLTMVMVLSPVPASIFGADGDGHDNVAEPVRADGDLPTVYVRTNIMTPGNTYLIVGSCNAGTSNALSHYGTALKLDEVTIHAADEINSADVNDVWIDPEDVDAGSVWEMRTVTGGSQYNPKQVDKLINDQGSSNCYYIITDVTVIKFRSRNNGYDTVNNSYNATGSYLQIGSNKYIQYTNGSFSATSTVPTSSNTVYIYVKTQLCDHDYSCPGMEWNVSASGESAAATATYTCSICGKVVTLDASVSREDIPGTCEQAGKWKYTATVTGPDDEPLTETKIITKRVEIEAPGSAATRIYIPVTTFSTDKTYVIVNTNQTGTAHAIASDYPNTLPSGSVSGSIAVRDSIAEILEGTASIDGLTEPYHGKYIAFESDTDAGDAVWTAVEVADEGICFSNGGYDLFHDSRYVYLDMTGQDHDKCWELGSNFLRYESETSAGSYCYLSYDPDDTGNGNQGWCIRRDDEAYGNVYLFEEVTATIWVKTYVDVTPGHSWGQPDYAWAADYSTVTASRVCSVCSAKETETVSATGVPTAPTCTEAGCTTYTSAAFENEAFTVQTKIVEGEAAAGHSWGQPDYTWAADYSTVTASRVCSVCSVKETETVSATGVPTAPTCTEAGCTTYTSAAFENEAFTVQTKIVEGEAATGHSWGQPDYAWAADYSTVTASRVCSVCSAKETETVSATGVPTAPTCTEAGCTTYTSAAFENEAFTVQTKIVEGEAAAGHSWGQPVWNWTGFTAATATFTCANDSSHKEVIDAEITSEVRDGAVHYYAEVVFENAHYYDNKTEEFEYATITKVTLELLSKIGIRVYVKVPENARTAMIFFEDVKTHEYETEPSVTMELTTEGNKYYNPKTGEFLVIFPKITSRQMTMHIKFVVYDENDQPMWLYFATEDDYHEGAFEYCVADWCNRVINTGANQLAVRMGKALLNYGGCAQKYLSNYNPDNPADPLGYLAEDMASFTPDTSNDMAGVDEARETVGLTDIRLNLAEETSIRLFFNKAVTVKVDGKNVSVATNGKQWLAVIDGIYSRFLDHAYKIEVTGDDGISATFSYSALSWSNDIIDRNVEAAVPTAKALYLYHYAAVDYLGQ